jgi:hypothetical protein
MKINKYFWGFTTEKKAIRAQKRNWGFKISMVGRVIYLSIGNVIWGRKNIFVGVKKVKISHQSPKTEFGF